MVFRSIYHFTQAIEQGISTNLVAYLTAPENRDLGVVKAPRPQRQPPPLDLSPFPGSQVLTPRSSVMVKAMNRAEKAES
ncbi:hypothetical protein HC931_19675 [Candidatus Gracilibacteria bacterium]|nr:hypothetical protein [Candidatus Gracilibacteria bacterium]NJM88905.1 hypothetical protein [Hydrococcus sp. RU_2_2]NJP19857.1 hypothetical protein [Hydrococcus sp. CRU_1_1]